MASIVKVSLLHSYHSTTSVPYSLLYTKQEFASQKLESCCVIVHPNSTSDHPAKRLYGSIIFPLSGLCVGVRVCHLIITSYILEYR